MTRCVSPPPHPTERVGRYVEHAQLRQPSAAPLRREPARQLVLLRGVPGTSGKGGEGMFLRLKNLKK